MNDTIGRLMFGPARSFFDDFDYTPEFRDKFIERYNRDRDDNGNYIIEVPVPGFNKDNIEVLLNKDHITVQGETKTRTLHKNVFVSNKVTDVKASVEDGILTLTLLYDNREDTKKIPVD